MVKETFKRIRDQYVINQVQHAKIPTFHGSAFCRYRIRFSGRVQKVGFRLEVTELAKRLDLTGFCENLSNGDVYAELQGEHLKIQFLISFMESLKRIRIKNMVSEEVPICENETGFVQR